MKGGSNSILLLLLDNYPRSYDAQWLWWSSGILFSCKEYLQLLVASPLNNLLRLNETEISTYHWSDLIHFLSLICITQHTTSNYGGKTKHARCRRILLILTWSWRVEQHCISWLYSRPVWLPVSAGPELWRNQRQPVDLQLQLRLLQCRGGEWAAGDGERRRSLVSGQPRQGEQLRVAPGEWNSRL